jgi:uncharacterized protein YbcI
VEQSEQDQQHSAPGQSLGAQISKAIVQLLREHGGRGPTRCKTYFDDDLILVLLRGGSTSAEQTMFQAGKWLDVRQARHVFQDSMEGRFTQEIEHLTGRHVLAFMSASHQDPDLTIEAFLLDVALEDAPSGPDMAVSKWHS